MLWKRPASAAGRRKRLKEQQLARCNNPELAQVVERNIDTIEEHRIEAEKDRDFQTRLADAITSFTGSMPFVYLHAVWFVAWIIANMGIGGWPAFDPFPYGLLTTIVSLEAIFLSTFVLVSQNRQAQIADKRAELDLQINLLSEYEVTRILKLVAAIAKHHRVENCEPTELKQLKKDVKPKAVLEELETREERQNGKQTARRPRRPKTGRGPRKGSTRNRGTT